MKTRLFLVVLVLISLTLLLNNFSGTKTVRVNAQNKIDQRSLVFTELVRKAETLGRLHVIVELTSGFKPEGNLMTADLARQHTSIKEAQTSFLGRYPVRKEAVKTFDYIPFVALETDANQIRQMESDPAVGDIEEDIVGEPGLAESIPMVSADTAWASGYTGAGQTVAIVDSGVDKTHSFLSPRVVSEACYSSNVINQSVSVCPAGVTESTDPSSGLNCPVSTEGCAHGTNVAGIAAGRGASFSGVAKDANIVAIQIFSQFTSSASCGTTVPCARYWTSDLIKGLERVLTLKATMPSIQAVNLSLQTPDSNSHRIVMSLIPRPRRR